MTDDLPVQHVLPSTPRLQGSIRHRSRWPVAAVWRFGISVFVTLGCVGCGDDSPATGQPDAQIPADAGLDAMVEPCPEVIEPEGPLLDPSELTLDACQPGTLAGLDLAGLWYQRLDEPGGGQNRPLRFSRVCEQLQLALPSGQMYVTENDDEIFWRHELAFPGGILVTAGKICLDNEDGTYAGASGSCYVPDGADPFCSAAVPHTLLPFERIDGESEGDGVTLVGEWRPQDDATWEDALPTNVRVVEDIAYLSTGNDGMRIVDISDPTSPTQIGHLPGEQEFMNDIKLVDGPDGSRYALLASAPRGLVIADVSAPEQPTLSGVIQASAESGLHTLFVETVEGTTYAYLADGFSELIDVVDVTDPASPVVRGTYPAPTSGDGVHDLYAKDGRLYLNATFAGMIVADVLPNPTMGTQVGVFQPEAPQYSHSNWVTQAGGRTISVHGDEGFDAHVKIVDVDPASPEFMQVIGEYRTRDIVSVHNIMAFGDRAYVSYYQDGIRILDLSDPTQPTEIGYFNTWDAASAGGNVFEGAIGIDVDAASGRIYIADTIRGLLILNSTL